MDLVLVAVAAVLVVVLLWALFAVRRTALYKRQLEAQRRTSARLARLEARLDPVFDLIEGAIAGAGSCLVILVLMGVVALVAVAVVLWAWRTVFGGP
jgi:hypothetical protein